ncbi:MAG: hypothetical protein KF812_07955 [Fimbriimonadaceae bacterium]|nr:hypothetical protein [Fimbriimonadaceae bacterium]
MSKAMITAVAAAAVLAVPAFAAGPNSGLNTGERVSAFHPMHVAGPLANSTNCFPCTFQNRPQVQAWINGDSPENVAAIAKTLDSAMTTHAGAEFKALVVWMTNPGSEEAAKANAKTFVEANGLKNVGVAIIAKNHEAVGLYKVNTASEVKNTVFVYKNWTVTNKMVNVAGTEGIASLRNAIGQAVR